MSDRNICSLEEVLAQLDREFEEADLDYIGPTWIKKDVPMKKTILTVILFLFHPWKIPVRMTVITKL